MAGRSASTWESVPPGIQRVPENPQPGWILGTISRQVGPGGRGTRVDCAIPNRGLGSPLGRFADDLDVADHRLLHHVDLATQEVPIPEGEVTRQARPTWPRPIRTGSPADRARYRTRSRNRSRHPVSCDAVPRRTTPAPSHPARHPSRRRTDAQHPARRRPRRWRRHDPRGQPSRRSSAGAIVRRPGVRVKRGPPTVRPACPPRARGGMARA